MLLFEKIYNFFLDPIDMSRLSLSLVFGLIPFRLLGIFGISLTIRLGVDLLCVASLYTYALTAIPIILNSYIFQLLFLEVFWLMNGLKFFPHMCGFF